MTSIVTPAQASANVDPMLLAETAAGLMMSIVDNMLNIFGRFLPRFPVICFFPKGSCLGSFFFCRLSNHSLIL